MPRKTYWEILLRCFAYNIGSMILGSGIVALISFHLINRSNNYWVLIIFGIMGGVLFGFVWSKIIAPYGKEIAISLTFKNKCEIINKLDTALKRMNYRLESKNNNILVYCSSKWMEDFAGKISVHLYDTSVTIAGSSKHVRRIWKKLKAAQVFCLFP
ncbi:MAG: hypothetical protein K6U80_11980 [Firmicutes bacterium]|nr:hypothetical protein [Bacillota bacterium]